MPDLHTLVKETRPSDAVRNNGPDDLTLERFKLRELAEGWPCYRDACEWENYKSIFHPDAYVYTTWTGRLPIADFIAASQAGMDNGAFIMHRVHGVTTDIMPSAHRAVTKMKATITQRFDLDGILVDVECDCRFLYFWSKVQSHDKNTGETAPKWGANYVRHWYEKDKMIPVDPRKIPEIDDEKLLKYPIGYRYLGYCQDATMDGVNVLLDLPIHRRENGEKHDLLYVQIKQWLDGEDVEV